jgi:hypothetical protein
MNFVLTRALGGGGVESLRIDPQGKALAQMLLDFPVPVPEDLAARHALTPAVGATSALGPHPSTGSG